MNKKLTIIIVIAFVVVGAAAFVGGRLLNGGVGPLGFMPFGPGGGNMSFSVSITPAPELPTTKPDLTGLYVSRKDNTLTVQSIPMNGGEKGGMVVSISNSDSGGDGGVVSASPADMGSGPKMEVVVTGKTIIYRDATAMDAEPPKENATIQQTVETGTLDDIHDQTMITVWGRKVGDRLIADVVLYSNPVIIKKQR